MKNAMTGLTIPAWLRRLGIGGFAFFLAKGLLWLTVPYLAAGLRATKPQIAAKAAPTSASYFFCRKVIPVTTPA
jgi:hypothetical protein